MGLPWLKVDEPEDCQTSEEAKSIADRLMILGNSRNDDAVGMFGLGNGLSANSAFEEAQRYYQRAEYLKSQGK